MNTPNIKATLGTVIGIIILGVITYYIISLVAGIIKFFLVGGIIIILAVIIFNYFRSLFKKN